MMNLFVGIKRIYGLKSNNKTFLKLDDYNTVKKTQDIYQYLSG